MGVGMWVQSNTPLGQPGGHSLQFEKGSHLHILQPLEGSQFVKEEEPPIRLHHGRREG